MQRGVVVSLLLVVVLTCYSLYAGWYGLEHQTWLGSELIRYSPVERGWVSSARKAEEEMALGLQDFQSDLIIPPYTSKSPLSPSSSSSLPSPLPPSTSKIETSRESTSKIETSRESTSKIETSRESTSNFETSRDSTSNFESSPKSISAATFSTSNPTGIERGGSSSLEFLNRAYRRYALTKEKYKERGLGGNLVFYRVLIDSTPVMKEILPAKEALAATKSVLRRLKAGEIFVAVKVQDWPDGKWAEIGRGMFVPLVLRMGQELVSSTEISNTNPIKSFNGAAWELLENCDLLHSEIPKESCRTGNMIKKELQRLIKEYDLFSYRPEEGGDTSVPVEPILDAETIAKAQVKINKYSQVAFAQEEIEALKLLDSIFPS